MALVRLDRLQQLAVVNLLLDPGAIPGPVVVPQCAQISFLWNQEDGKIAHNVLYGRYTGSFAGSVTQANAIMMALTEGTAWTGLAAVLSTLTRFAAVHIRDVNSPNQPIIESDIGTVGGADPANALPNEIAIVATLRTALTGRMNRGRMYLPGFTVSSLGIGNTIAASTMTAIEAWVATIFGALSAQGYGWVLGQRARQSYTGSTGTVHPARPANSVPITAALVRDNHWDTQRRRGLK
jgi:hypothetical protein